MRGRLRVIFVFIVLAPLVVLAWLGARVARNEQEMVRHRVRDLLVSKLRDADARVTAFMAERERELSSQSDLRNLSFEQLHERARASRLVRQYFIFDQEGLQIAYPLPGGSLGTDEAAFLERMREVRYRGTIPPFADPQAPSDSQNALPANVPQQGLLQNQAIPHQTSPDKGWYVWYWGDGVDIVFWWRDTKGIVMVAELGPAHLMKEIAAILPVTDPSDPAMQQARIVLRHATGAAIHQWGGYDVPKGAQPEATLPLSPPLSFWRLDCYTSSQFIGPSYGHGVWFNLLSGLGFIAIAVISLAFYYYRETTRDMREARQRISFVNQVSHELKTPLTSIRMYAEMLDDEAGDASPAARRHIEVIVAESQRLSRLIANVLTFSRKQRSAPKLNVAPGRIDATIEEVLAHFEAPLRAQGISMTFRRAAADEVLFDRDALEQIMGNLLGNVEKYARGGTSVSIASRYENGTAVITVDDDGPGIPEHEREKIFAPFHRVSNALTDGVAGTGIGLTIARDLARLHGGNLTVEAGGKGARFQLVIRAKKTETNRNSMDSSFGES